MIEKPVRGETTERFGAKHPTKDPLVNRASSGRCGGQRATAVPTAPAGCQPVLASFREP
jgi:hypothetical protein